MVGQHPSQLLSMRQCMTAHTLLITCLHCVGMVYQCDTVLSLSIMLFCIHIISQYIANQNMKIQGTQSMRYRIQCLSEAIFGFTLYPANIVQPSKRANLFLSAVSTLVLEICS